MNSNNLGQLPQMIARSLEFIHQELKKIRETLEKIEKKTKDNGSDK